MIELVKSYSSIHWCAQGAGDPKTQRDTGLRAQTVLSLTPRTSTG
jgi:hypothetical protein